MNEAITAETLSGLKEDSGRPRKKARKGGLKEARKEAPVEAPKDDIEKMKNALATAMRDGFERCLKEIKLLGDRLEAVEKKVGITKSRTSGSPKPPVHEQGVKAPQKYAIPQLHDSPATSQLSVLVLDKRVPTASDIRQGDLRRQTKKDKMIAEVGQAYDPFALANKKMLEVLTAWLKLDPYFKTPMDKKPRLCPTRFYFKL
ncbi:hypothetical protein Bca52824_017945 [Brassica carinata]|uniref:Uncharacterized protein n=1 Tax=Brassica carinata TaxID=52824 RepID=A0A8X7VN05_BRACI|nr:hypothetical protein Bca52824_017945 [Brassica carinata]